MTTATSTVKSVSRGAANARSKVGLAPQCATQAVLATPVQY